MGGFPCGFATGHRSDFRRVPVPGPCPVLSPDGGRISLSHEFFFFANFDVALCQARVLFCRQLAVGFALSVCDF